MSNPIWQYLPGINSFSGDFGIAFGAIAGGSTPSSGAFPAANDALLVPFCLNQSALIKRLFAINGGTASGNIDMGIYAESGAKIVSIGSTAQSGTTTVQFFDITDTFLGPGRYYIAVAMDNTTGTLFRANPSVARLQTLGMAKQATAFALPTSITFATVTALYLPLIGAEISEIR